MVAQASVRANKLAPFRLGEIAVGFDFHFLGCLERGLVLAFDAPIFPAFPSAIRTVRDRGTMELRWRQFRSADDMPCGPAAARSGTLDFGSLLGVLLTVLDAPYACRSSLLYAITHSPMSIFSEIYLRFCFTDFLTTGDFEYPGGSKQINTDFVNLWVGRGAGPFDGTPALGLRNTYVGGVVPA
jgi:hypothetical protein